MEHISNALLDLKTKVNLLEQNGETNKLNIEGKKHTLHNFQIMLRIQFFFHYYADLNIPFILKGIHEFRQERLQLQKGSAHIANYSLFFYFIFYIS